MAQYNIFRPWAAESWGAYDDLHREMDALLGRFRGGATHGPTGVFPATNLYEAAENYVLTAELPGVSPDDIEVSLEGSTVSLRGERKIDYIAASDNLDASGAPSSCRSRSIPTRSKPYTRTVC